VLCLLRSTPALEDLVLYECIYHTHGSSARAVALPNLRCLELVTVTHICDGFFWRLELSRPLTRLHIKDNPCARPDRDIMPFLAAWDIPSPDTAGWLEITIHNDSRYIYEVHVRALPDPGPEFIFEIDLCFSNINGILQSLFNALPAPILTHLTIIIPNLHDLNLRTTLEQASSLRQITIYPSDFRSLTDLLTCAPGGNAPSPAPALQSITLAKSTYDSSPLDFTGAHHHSTPDLTEFLECIAQRHALGYALRRMTFENSRDSWDASVQWSLLEDIGVELLFGSTTIIGS